jgi:hypothetical protein
MHYAWMEWQPGGLHAVPALFLGIVVLVLLGGAAAAIRSLRNAPKDTDRARSFRLTMGRGGRWLVSREPWRVGGWTLLFAASVIVLFYNVERWRGKRAWAAVERDARLRGESLDARDANPAPVPDDQNFAKAPLFAPLLAALTEKPPGSWPGRAPNLGALEPVAAWGSGRQPSPGVERAPWLTGSVADLEGWLRAIEAAAGSDPLEDTTRKPSPPDHRPRREIAEQILVKLQPFDADLSQLHEFSNRPFCRLPLEYSLQMLTGDQITPVLMGYVRILSIRASARIELGKNHAALDDVRLALRMVGFAMQQPWVMAAHRRLEAFAESIQPIWEALQDHRWSPLQLTALQSQLENLDLLGFYHATVRNDALAQADLLESMIPTSGRPRVPTFRWEEPTNDAIGKLIRWAYPTGWSLQNQAAVHRYHLDVTSRHIDANSRVITPVSPSAARAGATSDPLYRVVLFPRTRELFVTAAEGFVHAQTVVHLATLACALERHRLSTGSHPETLDALVPGFVAQLPHDILNGKPLIYRRTTNGFTLYSVGGNQVDDGGRPGSRPLRDGSSLPRFGEGDWVWASSDEHSGG